MSAAYTYATEFHVTVTATNDCGSVTATRSFRTRDEHPPRCPTCDEQTYLTAGGGDRTDAALPGRGATNEVPPERSPAGIEVLPNPNAGNFDVYYVRATADAPLTATAAPSYVLLDMLGRTVAAGSLAAPTTHVATSQLSTGIYILKILDGNQSRYKRVQLAR